MLQSGGDLNGQAEIEAVCEFVARDMGFTVRKAMACCRSNVFVLDGDAGWTIEDVPCGNRVALAGLDQFITKNSTLTNEKEVDAHPIRAMKFSVACCVCCCSVHS
ncbi:hypothetical protein KIW84_020330 [Lathyrus oleraceus]|uniref:Uncharacterized protein n=1 Tax=Pisum sativum TaxID=3888 RepID=A0A9D4Y4R3_PEA|nr:hypothetical protein KIW84_020330 [Pisum sativum]